MTQYTIRLVALSLLVTTPAIGQSNFESSKISPGVVVEGAGFESPKLAPGIVLENGAMQSSKFSSGVVLENGAFQSPKISVGIVLESLPNAGGAIMRAPLTHW